MQAMSRNSVISAKKSQFFSTYQAARRLVIVSRAR